MASLTHHDITILFVSLGILLASARILGEIARLFQQPAVLGEIIAGILLGPTVFGSVFPNLHETLFPGEGAVLVALQGFTAIAIALFLMVAGMEVDLSTAWRQGKTASVVAFLGIVVPFTLGFVTTWFMEDLFSNGSKHPHLILSLFIATAMSISALPVIARILMDLNIYRTDLGMFVISAAILNDLAGWIIFGVLLGLIDTGGASTWTTGQVLILIVLFTGGMMTLGRGLFNRLLPWIQAHLSWPAGVLSFVMTMAFLSAAITEWIGVHAIFGAFMLGVAIGDSPHLRQRTRTTIEQFISSIFAPIFFASIGLRVNFFTNFDLQLVVVVIVIATIGKVVGCTYGAKWCGLPNREALAIGFGMNARGAMEIILGLLALEKGLIDERLFVALVVMAMVTSLSSGTLIQWILQPKAPVRFSNFLAASRFQPALKGMNREQVVRELASLAAGSASLDATVIGDKAWEREQVMSTGLENGLAVPHARLPDLKQPIVALGLSEDGVDFDSFDGQPTRLVFLILTPQKDNGSQLEILADISRTFQDPKMVAAVFQSRNYTEFLAIIRSHEDERG